MVKRRHKNIFGSMLSPSSILSQVKRLETRISVVQENQGLTQEMKDKFIVALNTIIDVLYTDGKISTVELNTSNNSLCSATLNHQLEKVKKKTVVSIKKQENKATNKAIPSSKKKVSINSKKFKK
jgi:hypothetical protein